MPNTNPNAVSVSIYLDKESLRKLDAILKRQGRNRSELIRSVLDRYVTWYEKKHADDAR